MLQVQIIHLKYRTLQHNEQYSEQYYPKKGLLKNYKRKPSLVLHVRYGVEICPIEIKSDKTDHLPAV